MRVIVSRLSEIRGAPGKMRVSFASPCFRTPYYKTARKKTGAPRLRSDEKRSKEEATREAENASPKITRMSGLRWYSTRLEGAA